MKPVKIYKHTFPLLSITVPVCPLCFALVINQQKKSNLPR